MVLKCLGSSSSGNCYLLEAEKETLIIEAGVDMREVKKALDWQMSKVCGCLISHEHNDHAKFLSEMTKNGIKVLAIPEVFDAKRVKNRVFCKEIEPMHGYKVGGFKVFVLSVVHDVPCVGFIIEHEEMGRLLFITDTMMLEYNAPNLDHIMIEANYSDDILQENIDNGIMPLSMRDRLLHSHMEIKTTEDVLKSTDLRNVREVILLHLSARNSNAEQFSQSIRKIAGKPTYVAKSGLKLDLSLNDF